MRWILLFLYFVGPIASDDFFSGLELDSSQHPLAKEVQTPEKLLLDVPLFGQMEADPFYRGPLDDKVEVGGDEPHSYCGPTSVQMILAYYSQPIPRHELVQELRPKGTLFGIEKAEELLKEKGFFTERAWTANLDQLKSSILQGNPVMISLQKNAFIRDGEEALYKTGSGHIMVLVGFDANDNPILNDPYGKPIDGHRPPKQITFPWSKFKKVISYALLIRQEA